MISKSFAKERWSPGVWVKLYTYDNFYVFTHIKDSSKVWVMTRPVVQLDFQS